MLGWNITPYWGLPKLSEYRGSQRVYLNIAQAATAAADHYAITALIRRPRFHDRPFQLAGGARITISQATRWRSPRPLNLLLLHQQSVPNLPTNHGCYCSFQRQSQRRKRQFHCTTEALHQEFLGRLLQIQWLDLDASWQRQCSRPRYKRTETIQKKF